MKHVLALILACCVLFAFSGCAKMNGERVSFGYSYPCKQLRGNVYYITHLDDLRRILELKARVDYSNPCNGESDVPSIYDKCHEKESHRMLRHELSHYSEGFLGWF
jgi:hypothetical protein